MHGSRGGPGPGAATEQNCGSYAAPRNGRAASVQTARPLGQGAWVAASRSVDQRVKGAINGGGAIPRSPASGTGSRCAAVVGSFGERAAPHSPFRLRLVSRRWHLRDGVREAMRRGRNMRPCRGTHRPGRGTCNVEWPPWMGAIRLTRQRCAGEGGGSPRVALPGRWLSCSGVCLPGCRTSSGSARSGS